jgi:hypothetical protein
MTAAAPEHSAVYVGKVRHRRFGAVPHEFSVRLFLCYVDLDEVEACFGRRLLWSARRFAPMWFRRRDYFGPPDVPLADAVRDAVAARTGLRPDGPVRLLTSVRTFGYVFNPVSIYYCFDAAERLVAVLAEITNTPWGERHHYVVAAPPGGRVPLLRSRFAKEFHVSPFQPMEQVYSWALTAPGERLAVRMENFAADSRAFDATLAMRRRPWTTRNLLAAVARHPWMTAKVILTIHWQALRLWWKGAVFHVHPSKRGERCPGRS